MAIQYFFLMLQQSHVGNMDTSPHPPENHLPFEEAKRADCIHCIEKKTAVHISTVCLLVLMLFHNVQKLTVLFNKKMTDIIFFWKL